MAHVIWNVFALFGLIAAIMVIRAKNPVYAVLFLILVFCNTSGLLLLIDLDFFALIFLVVYVGAIAILFLFVVMMLNMKLAEMNENILRYLPFGGLFGVLFLMDILLIIDHDIVPFIAYDPVSGISMYETVGLYITMFGFVVSGTFFGSNLSQSMQHVQMVSQTFNDYSLDSVSMNKMYLGWPHTIEQDSTIEAIGQVLYTYNMYFFILACIILLIAMIGSIVLTMHKSMSIKRQDAFAQNTRDWTKTLTKLKRSTS